MALPSSLLAKVGAQLEFYFSDSNLPRDRFLREAVEENEGGFVPSIGLHIKRFEVSGRWFDGEQRFSDTLLTRN